LSEATDFGPWTPGGAPRLWRSWRELLLPLPRFEPAPLGADRSRRPGSRLALGGAGIAPAADSARGKLRAPGAEGCGAVAERVAQSAIFGEPRRRGVDP